MRFAAFILIDVQYLTYFFQLPQADSNLCDLMCYMWLKSQSNYVIANKLPEVNLQYQPWAELIQ